MRKRRILYIVCVLSVLALNILYVEYQFFLMLLLVLLVPLMSWILFVYSVSGLKMYISLPQEMVEPGETAEIRVRAVNRRFFFAGKQVFMVGVHHSNTPSSQQELLEITGISDGMQTAVVSFEPEHSGIVDISIRKVSLQDYIGLFKVKRNFEGGCQLVVLPKPVLSLKVKPGLERQQEYHYSPIEDDDTDIVDLRPFRPGDNLNHIHWNLSLRTDELVVRQYGERASAKNVILVDLSEGKAQNFRTVLDKIYTAVYSIANLYIENGMETMVLAWDDQQKRMVCLEFDNEEGMIQAMAQLMQITCSSRAGEKVVSEYLKAEEAGGAGVLFVTAENYENRRFEVMNVSKTEMQQMIDSLWEKI